MPESSTDISPEHQEFLKSQAVDPGLAARLGVRTLSQREDSADMGSVWVNWTNHPALAFPWTSPDGRVEWQVRADNPTTDGRGRPRKYVFRKDMTPILWAVRTVEDPTGVLIIEGTKQCLAGAGYAPDGWSVYGIAGCRMWQKDGSPIPDLGVVDGRKTVIILDADAAENQAVYQAGLELADALKLEGAASVSFGQLPSGGKSGLDDVLSGRPETRRAGWLARVIDGAKAKPAEKAPTRKKKTREMPEDSDRVTVIVNRDRLDVINALTSALLEKWNGRTLFNHGGVISRLKGTGMHPVDKGSFNDLIQETAVTVTENEGAQGTSYGYAWPDTASMSAVASRADRFAVLERVAHAPFVRPDGTVVTDPGYDEPTRTMLIPDPDLEGVDVPENPTAAQVIQARTLLMEEWLGDFPVDTDADRANLLALVITPVIRGMVPRAPLAVIDGLQMGVGKNLLADSITTIYTGQAAQPMNWVSEGDELRKQITSAFRTGAEFFVFDEAHVLEGTALAQALTAETWQDRILGVSTMAYFPNRVTWVSLGNNVQVKGDITRRVYRIALRPKYANPQDRPSHTFRHPGQSGLDLGAWTRKNRKALLEAVLTLVRAWYANGSPYPERGVSFGSFEAWERIVGGILETAGMPGFLGDLKVWRSESDFDGQYWTSHLQWLREEFGSSPFRTADVKKAALTDLASYQAPPRLDDPTEKAYGKALGEGYSRVRDRQYDGLRMEKAGVGHGHVTLWRVLADDDLPGGGPDDDGGQPDPEPVDTPPSTSPDPAPGDTDGEGHDESRPASPLSADVVAFDLETGDADDLYRTGPGYVRIGATATDSGDVTPYGPPETMFHLPVAENVVADLRTGRTVTGHNIMAFDIPALVREGALDMAEVHRMADGGQFFDTLLAARHINPPMAREKGVDATRRYDLGNLGQAYGLGEKLTDVSKKLAKKYGGWGDIPVDDSEDGRAFTQYMVQDVELSRKLHATLLEELGGTVPEYLVREHRVAALAAQMSLNGFRVDRELLAVRVQEVQDRKTEALGWLNQECGVPLADPKGKAFLSPLATKAGKEAVETALTMAGMDPDFLWRTPKSGDLQLSADAMTHYAREYGGNRRVVDICRQVHRIVSARTVYDTISNATMPDGRVHPKVSFRQATGRWSLTDPGLTVLGKRGGRHVERAVLLPDPGDVLIAVDLSQVDMRAVAGLSQDQAYIDMLRKDDPHRELAITLFGGAEFRESAKAIGHGWNYGESLRRISTENDIEPDLVNRFDQSMRERFGRLVEWREEVRALAGSGALLDNGWGRAMRPDPQRAHTQGPALMGQGAARDIMMNGLLRLDRRILPMLRAQVHDEIVLSVPAAEAEEISRAVVDALSFDWKGVPILADSSKPGVTWADCYSK